MKDQLYLMQPGFINAGLGPFYCGDSVSVEGLLGFFPELREKVDVHYIAFPRPRQPLVDALGEENQSIPVLILADDVGEDSGLHPTRRNGRAFFSDEKAIRSYLSDKFGLPHSG
ncbi:MULTISPECIES: DUF3088 domain-containing protein [unclassified Sphingobium]|uniref:DUF3088 domain-containing protein n=1 Tax=unclassified Sphingobium TaxID=2611147 RepID=UPI000C453DB3|nr:DUF3088 domain-containing protein [Sphingobium sp.]MBU0659081.1 DUF3088 domain-containing protein [Alphaproteobacteria bacterium]MBS89348.1 hypothetical protein [Sphingobium sp.]MBU0774800.1 DUF3088 domain-containing protein [Alphaproteobacteria bacterium]MBU1258242.1 DUF3088 domain-containing protein [Alphaproteobacteria bacterium]MBU1463892.1 DUF3088 domain-containing protein [Alphaproteobacteria bacterium]